MLVITASSTSSHEPHKGLLELAWPMAVAGRVGPYDREKPTEVLVFEAEAVLEKEVEEVMNIPLVMAAVAMGLSVCALGFAIWEYLSRRRRK